jgi:hypothetical protein
MKSRLKSLGVVLGAMAFAAGTVMADENPTSTQTPAGFALAQDPGRTVIVTPPPPGGTTDVTYQTWNSNLFIGGAVLFGAAYGAAVVGASQSDRSADNRLYVPLLGPWLDLADRGDCPVEQQSCDNETTMKVLIIGDGILQAAGVFMMVDAALFPKTVHKTVPTTALRHVKPIRVGEGGRGLAWSGKF